MNAQKRSAELQELLEAMDTVIGASAQAAKPAGRTVQKVEGEDIQPILDRIKEREKQRKYHAAAAA